MRFVKLTELYMEKGLRDRIEGESAYADRDIYTPKLAPVWVNLDLIVDMRPTDNEQYRTKHAHRYPAGYPDTTRLTGADSSYTVTESVEEILTRVLQNSPSTKD